MIKFEVDIDGDCPVAEVIALLERHGARVEDFKYQGPGGGNPCFTLSLPTEEAVISFRIALEHSEAAVSSFIEE